MAEYNKVRGSLLRLSTGLEGRNRGVENQQSNLRQCDYGLISHQCHSTVHVKSQSIVHFPPKYPAFMMKRYSVQNKIRLIFPEIKHVKRAWHVQTIVPHILDYAVKCQGWSIKICIKKTQTQLYIQCNNNRKQVVDHLAGFRAYYHDVTMTSPPLCALTSQWRLTCYGWTPWRRPGGCTGHGVTFSLWAALSAPPSQPSSPEPSARTHSASPVGALTCTEQRCRIYWIKLVLHYTITVVK